MSRNQDRIGALASESSVVPINSPIQPQSEISFGIPTEYVELPSRGKYYPNDHPLYGQEKIEIRFMTAAHENILTSNSYIEEGVALEKLLTALIVDSRIDSKSILSKDRDAIFLAARRTNIDHEYHRKIFCPACHKMVQSIYDLNQAFIEPEPEFSKLNIEITDKNTFIFKLPRSGLVVELRLLTGYDEDYIANTTKMRKKNNLPEAKVTIFLERIILSIDGKTDPNYINLCINERITSFDSKYIRNVYKLVSPSLNTTQKFVCSNCKYEQDMEVSFSVDFFWPEQ